MQCWSHTLDFCSTGPFFELFWVRLLQVRILQVGPVPKSKRLGIVVPELLQAECFSCSQNNSIKALKNDSVPDWGQHAAAPPSLFFFFFFFFFSFSSFSSSFFVLLLLLLRPSSSSSSFFFFLYLCQQPFPKYNLVPGV